ncbi:PEP/pyruvate-binding domain-containing protein [uncultured Roseibium sp.]|uniref:PEP/pyruvate-binding domain-containing protein n=1 Tax=uncultured Roseibium sp. TaxID=1936171 RepID=UPI002622B10B|nr:PEP/pyruvate-binding domain-containing protein [uncultured Roseibium sp.]
MTALFTSQDALESSAQVIGGKARVLADLARAGYKVPPFFVIPSASFENGQIAEAQKSAIHTACDALGGTQFAVRSSASSEDGHTESHAGQFLTFLDVAAADVPSKAEAVFASGLGDSVAAYRAAQGIADINMPSVIVQAMVDARAAGVAFAADPVTGRRDQIVVSATEGLGDALVSGEVSGETWRFSHPRLETLERPGGDSASSEEDARAIADLCISVSEKRGQPQDIEWAFSAETPEPFLLQARPITTRLLPAGVAEKRLLVFDNSNIVESYPGLVSPLTYSFAVAAYARVYTSFLALIGTSPEVIKAHATDLENMLARIDGRMYYNLGSWYRLLSLLPFFSSNRQHMETMMGVAEPLPDEVMAGIAPSKSPLAAAKMVARLAFAAFRLNAIKKGFMKRVVETVPPRETWHDLEDRPLSELAGEYRRVEHALLDDWDAPIVNDFLCMMAFGGSRSLLQRWAGEPGLALHNDVMIGQGDIVSAEPARLIRQIGERVRETPGAADILASGDEQAVFALPGIGNLLKDYLNRFGDRRIGELKLEEPTLDEAPMPLFRAVSASASRPGVDPERVEPDEVLKSLFRGRPQRVLARLILSYAKARVRDRENLRFERTRIFGYARRVFRAIGKSLTALGHLNEPDDVFFLTLEEVLATVEGSAVNAGLKGLVALRRAEQEEAAGLPEPAERILVRGTAFDRAQRMATHGPGEGQSHLDPNDIQRHGTACGGGRVEGIARVIRDPAEEQVQPGEILVARHTDPGWISHFANAAAVIGERGSVLSHSAIVSRELGIPCVVAVPEACDWIATGDRLEVDGSAGWVRKLS